MARQTPTERANKIFKSRWMIGMNIWLLGLLCWGAYQTYIGKAKAVWLMFGILTIMLFNWSIWMENLITIEEKMFEKRGKDGSE